MYEVQNGLLLFHIIVSLALLSLSLFFVDRRGWTSWFCYGPLEVAAELAQLALGRK